MSTHRHESCLTTCYIYSQFLVNKWSYFSKTNFLMTNRYRSAAVKGLQTLTISFLHVANDMYQCLYHVFIFHLRTFSRQHSEVLGIPDVVWEAGGLKSTVQTDGWNCGVFVCMVSYYYCKVYRHTHFHNMCLCHKESKFKLPSVVCLAACSENHCDFLCVLGGGGGGKKALAYSNTVLNCFIKRAWCWKVKHIPVLYFRDTFVSLCKVLCYSVLKQNAMAIVRGMDLTRISAHHAAAFRRYILAILHTKTRTLAEHLKECNITRCQVV